MFRNRKLPLVRDQDVVVRQEGDEHFLIDEELGAIHTLNAVGAAVWQLLAAPISMNEIVAHITEAFPDVEKIRITKDVARLLEDLHDQDLIGPAWSQNETAKKQ